MGACDGLPLREPSATTPPRSHACRCAASCLCVRKGVSALLTSREGGNVCEDRFRLIGSFGDEPARRPLPSIRQASIGFDRCSSKPSRNACARSSERANAAVNAAAGMSRCRYPLHHGCVRSARSRSSPACRGRRSGRSRRCDAAFRARQHRVGGDDGRARFLEDLAGERQRIAVVVDQDADAAEQRICSGPS